MQAIRNSGMGRFENIKNMVTISDVLLKYAGRTPNSNGLCLCPLHNDKGASLKIYSNKTFNCFGCGANGDVIDLCARINNISTGAACSLLEKDFNLPRQGVAPAELDRIRAEKAQQRIEEEKKRCAINAINDKIIAQIRELRAYNQWEWQKGITNRVKYENTRNKIIELENCYFAINDIPHNTTNYTQDELIEKIRTKQYHI